MAACTKKSGRIKHHCKIKITVTGDCVKSYLSDKRPQPYDVKNWLRQKMLACMEDTGSSSDSPVQEQRAASRYKHRVPAPHQYASQSSDELLIDSAVGAALPQEVSDHV